MDYALPVVWTIVLWWASTGVILYLVRRPRPKLRVSLATASALAFAALAGLTVTAHDTSVLGAYGAFTCGVVVWGWLEMTFLTGVITGSRRTACGHTCRGWHRFVHATQAIIHHELAIAAAGAVIYALTYGAQNRFGLWTFLVLWVMRLSAKLNLFLGVPNVSAEFLPARMSYLASFFTVSRMNLLFPFSIALSTAVIALLVQAATAAGNSSGELAGYTLLVSLMTLAIIEHWFMVLPIRSSALWNYTLRPRATPPRGS